MTVLYDTRGEEIRTGSSIIYAVKGSTFIQMHEAVVEGFWTRNGYGYEYPRYMIRARRVHDHKSVELYKTDTIVVIAPRINVPEGQMLARVELWDGVHRSSGQHLLFPTKTVVDLSTILKEHTFPYLVDVLVDNHLSSMR